MLFHVLLWELNTDGKHAYREDNAGYFEGDCIHILRIYDSRIRGSPLARVEDVGAVGTNHNAEEESPACFADIQLRGQVSAINDN
jgi:hypothetical protein